MKKPTACPTCHRPFEPPVKDGNEALTPKQRAVYDFIRARLEHGQPCPTIREIGKEFSVTTNAVADYLKRLVWKGWLIPPPQGVGGYSQSRSYSLPRG